MAAWTRLDWRPMTEDKPQAVFELPDIRLWRWGAALVLGTMVLLLATSKESLPETLGTLAQLASLPILLVYLVAHFARQRTQVASHGVAVERRVLGVLWRREQIPRDEIREIWMTWDQPEKKMGIDTAQRLVRRGWPLRHPVSLTRERGAPLLVTATETPAEAEKTARHLSALLGRPVSDEEGDVAPPPPERSETWRPGRVGAYYLLAASVLYLAALILNREWWPFAVALGAGFVLWIALTVRSFWLNRRRRANPPAGRTPNGPDILDEEKRPHIKATAQDADVL